MKPQKEQCTNAINQYICQLKKGHTGNCEDHRSVSEIAMSVGAVPPSRLRPQQTHEHPEACPICKSPYCEHSEREQNLIKAAWEAGYRAGEGTAMKPFNLTDAQVDALTENADAMEKPQQSDTLKQIEELTICRTGFMADESKEGLMRRLLKIFMLCKHHEVGALPAARVAQPTRSEVATAQRELKKSAFVIGVGFGYGACQHGKSETLTIQQAEEKWPKIQKEILGHWLDSQSE